MGSALQIRSQIFLGEVIIDPEPILEILTRTLNTCFGQPGGVEELGGESFG